MKVLFITDPGIVGGATKSLVELVATIHTLHPNVEITVCTSDYNSLNKDLTDVGVASIAEGHLAAMEVDPGCPSLIHARSFYRYWCDYYRRTNQYKQATKNAVQIIEKKLDIAAFDLIHTNSARNDLGCILGQKYNLPHVMHIREFGTDDFNCRFLRKNYYTFISEGTDIFLAVSQAVKNAWIKKGVPAAKIRVVYNGIDGKSIIAKDHSSYGDHNTLNLVMAGGIFPTKGQYQVIEAMSLLPEDIRKNISFTMYGWSETAYMRSLQEQIDKLELTSQVKWNGPIQNVNDVLRFYDVGLTCSRAEGFGRVTAEYMHAGLGVIASDTGANPELVKDGVNGQLYHYGDYQDLANKIGKYYKDRSLLKKHAECAKIAAKTKYTKEINAEKIYEVYCEILGKVRKE